MTPPRDAAPINRGGPKQGLTSGPSGTIHVPVISNIRRNGKVLSMSEKRVYRRHQCFEKIEFDYFEGNPDEIDIDSAVPVKCKGHMLDLSRGGAFLVTDTRVAINMPVRLRFRTKTAKYEVPGTIVRTGLLKNNPSEIAQKYAAVKVKEDAYIAVQFSELIEEIDESALTKS